MTILSSSLIALPQQHFSVPEKPVAPPPEKRRCLAHLQRTPDDPERDKASASFSRTCEKVEQISGPVIEAPLSRVGDSTSSPLMQKHSLIPPEATHSGGALLACTLKDLYVQLIRSQKKTYEGRIFSGPFLRYKIGMRVRWFAGSKSNVVTKITDVRCFKTFQEMLENIEYRKFLPEVTSLEEAVRIYLSIPTYRERSEKYGVVALGLLVLPDIPSKLKRSRTE